jgi:hypothetical protein
MRTIAVGLLAALIAAAVPACAAAATPAPKHAVHHPAKKSVVITGTVIAINGDLVQFRLDNGKTVSVDQHALILAGQPLTLGGHFALHGNYSDDIFVARPGGSDGGQGSNGYPYPGSTSNVQGIIMSISGDHVTIMQGLFSTIDVDDQQAINNGTAQNLYVGRSITAYGYWNAGTFYATSIG